jgi:hypothetical protein
MNWTPSSIFLRLGLCVALAFVVAGSGACKKSAESHTSAQSHTDSAQGRLEWNTKTTVDSYNSAAFTGTAWDGAARDCLTTFAQMRASENQYSQELADMVASNATVAVNAGCKDPLVYYLYVRFARSQMDTPEELGNQFYKAARELNSSSYPSVRKFYAGARGADQLFSLRSKIPDNRITELLIIVGDNLSDTLSDKTMPAEEAGEIANEALRLSSGDARNEELFYQRVEQQMAKNWPESYTRWYAKGNYYIDAAWSARGNGYADSVTPEAQRIFSSNLVQAREALEHAWKLDPQQTKIALQMLTVVLGQGSGRDQMETWFNRAMELDTNCYDACQRKLNFLAPKWYGSDDDQLAFGRECMHSAKWGGRVPLVLVDAHDSVNSRIEKARQAEYWKQPEVWADLQAAYDRFFELNPNAIGYYHNYARFAYQAEQWDKLNELIPKLGPINYEFFGGKQQFDKMVQLAKAHSHP